MNPAVVVRGLSKTFNDEGRGVIRAVDSIDLECRSGEVLGLLGANGAGKTTTLRLLATILKPSAGSAAVMGHDVTADPEGVRQQIGFLSSSTALYPRLTARETIALFGELGGLRGVTLRRRVAEVIGRFGLASFAEARVDKLSSGMKQKVSIARTVVHDPPVLIFDEPTVGLDVLNAIEMRTAIAQLRDEGKAILYSTHIMSEAEQLCDRIAIIHAGRIHACGSLADLRAASARHYLEDIFVHFVERASREDEARAAPGARSG